MKSCHVLASGVLIAVLAAFFPACGTSTGTTPPPPYTFPDYPDPVTFTTEYKGSSSLPNPFEFWDGTAVTQANWDMRAGEIADILQHYLTGYKHPDEGFTSKIESVSEPNGNGTVLLTIKVTREETGASGLMYANVNIPQGASPAGGWPVVMTVGGSSNGTSPANPSNYAILTAGGYAAISLPTANIAGTDSDAQPYIGAKRDSGLVNSLFPEVEYWTGTDKRLNYDALNSRYDTRYGWITYYGDLDAPGLMMDWVWGISRFIDALEAYNKDTAETERDFYVNPEKIAITGASRMGKLSLFAAAFEPRIAVAAPAETCAGGVNIDRFVSVSVNEADSRTNFPVHWRQGGATPMLDGVDNANWPPYNIDAAGNPTKTTFGPFDGYGALNKTYEYMRFEEIVVPGNPVSNTMIRATVVTAKEALIDPSIDPDGGVTKAFPNMLRESGYMGHVLWKGVPELADAAYDIYVDNNATNIKDGYGVHRWAYPYRNPDTATTLDRHWAGQNLGNIRWLYPNYWSARFHQFRPMYPDLNIHARHEQGDWGYFANLPFDMHFVSSLIAPRPMIVFGGMVCGNSGPESAFMNFLATREVYRLLDAEDNIGIRFYMHGHTQPAQTYLDIMAICDAHYAGSYMPDEFTPDSVEEYPYAINEPRSRFDYVKLDWAAPGYESIAEIVDRLVPANATSWDEIKLTDSGN